MPHAKAKFARHFGHFVDADALGNLVVIAIAALFQAFMQIDIAMPPPFPAVKANVENIRVARAINGLIRGHDPGFHRGHHRDHFESRPRWISALYGFGGQRAEFVFVQRGPISDGNAAHE